MIMKVQRYIIFIIMYIISEPWLTYTFTLIPFMLHKNTNGLSRYSHFIVKIIIIHVLVAHSGGAQVVATSYRLSK